MTFSIQACFSLPGVLWKMDPSDNGDDMENVPGLVLSDTEKLFATLDLQSLAVGSSHETPDDTALDDANSSRALGWNGVQADLNPDIFPKRKRNVVKKTPKPKKQLFITCGLCNKLCNSSYIINHFFQVPGSTKQTEMPFHLALASLTWPIIRQDLENPKKNDIAYVCRLCDRVDGFNLIINQKDIFKHMKIHIARTVSSRAARLEEIMNKMSRDWIAKHPDPHPDLPDISSSYSWTITQLSKHISDHVIRQPKRKTQSVRTYIQNQLQELGLSSHVTADNSAKLHPTEMYMYTIIDLKLPKELCREDPSDPNSSLMYNPVDDVHIRADDLLRAMDTKIEVPIHTHTPNSPPSKRQKVNELEQEFYPPVPPTAIPTVPPTAIPIVPPTTILTQNVLELPNDGPLFLPSLNTSGVDSAIDGPGEQTENYNIFNTEPDRHWSSLRNLVDYAGIPYYRPVSPVPLKDQSAFSFGAHPGQKNSMFVPTMNGPFAMSIHSTPSQLAASIGATTQSSDPSGFSLQDIINTIPPKKTTSRYVREVGTDKYMSAKRMDKILKDIPLSPETGTLLDGLLDEDQLNPEVTLPGRRVPSPSPDSTLAQSNFPADSSELSDLLDKLPDDLNFLDNLPDDLNLFVWEGWDKQG
jgi:hypothetical protein